MNAPQVLQANKALPSLTRDKLPRPPPREDPDFSSNPAPRPPTKSTSKETVARSNNLRPPPIDVAASNESLGQNLGTLPGSPSSPSSPDSRVIRVGHSSRLRFASAWSRSSLPPHELDLMFRSIEGIYKADRMLLSRLREFGTNPSSPQALGDILMRWVDDLEAPYTSYCERYIAGFDTWEPVRNNTRLPGVLAAFSTTLPPPNASSKDSDPQIWTLDELFLLPMLRLKYFKRLYKRLLKGAQPGRSDHKLLASASEKLDKLLAIYDTRASLKVGSSVPTAQATEDEVVSSHRVRFKRGLTSKVPISLTELDSRLAVDKCLDVFTMKPRAVRLQIAPPSLPYARTMRISADVAIRFVPRSTGVEVNHPGGLIFILSDLFLVCEKMAPGERSTNTPGADMWLLYPPLAGKHLKVAKVEGEDRAVQVTIMRKEKLDLVFSSVAMRERVLSRFKECIEFASAVYATSKHPLPPMPTLNGIPKAQPAPGDGDSIPSSQTAPDLRQSTGPPTTSSPISSPPSRNSHDVPMATISHMSNMPNQVPSIEAQTQQGGGWTQPVHDPHSTGTYPTRQSFQASFIGGTPLGPASVSQGPSPQPVFDPGQFPPQRATSADPLNRRGPLNLPQIQQPMPSIAPSSFQRPTPRLPPNPANGQVAPPNPHPIVPPGVLRKSPSASFLHAPPESRRAPPFDGVPRPGMGSMPDPQVPRARSMGHVGEPQSRVLPPSAQFRTSTTAIGSIDEPSPPTSPTATNPGPGRTMFLKQAHAQWKSLGSAKLKLYCQQPTNVKQLVVEAEDRNKSVLISTIVLTDGVERVAKTGVAVELSDNGSRTGIIYMIQLRNEQAAVGLYDSLLAGSDRMGAR
ncbi:hypothetical protein F5148DRAFT_1273287 [Russula earlei]|uniref:Uncharacterized protein n=1 Tax=Russula earlei TaxID=71964 RepID=A0ACC0UNG2_9AGAM|nr:hypothetical protein F5148DRAFT_1273287 [Russula earlei]